MSAYQEAKARVRAVDERTADEARARHDRLTKPQGALGRLEDLGVQLAAIAGEVPPPVPAPAAVAVFAADHGVVEEGVTPWPQEVTAQMVANFAAGGAAINVLARQMGASVTVVDVGVATDLATVGIRDASALRSHRVRNGTANLAREPAMSDDDARAALDVGAAIARDLVDGGARALVTGEMGIGNTTAAAAIVAAVTGRPARDVTGRGTGIDDVGLRRKIDVVDHAVGRIPSGATPQRVLAEVGGLEIAALAGFVVGGAAARVPVVVDGLIAGAALLIAVADCADVLGHVVAGHRSQEPGATAVLEHLGLAPVLDLELRLGEGSGACLALGPLEAAARILREMATFDDVGIDRGPDG